MKLKFTENMGKEGQIKTTVQSDPEKAFLMFHYLCNAAFGAQHDFTVEWEREAVRVDYD